MTERTDKTENTESGLTISTGTGHEYWEVPHSVDTRYGPHGYFRYIGKFPPQIARYLISEYSSPRDTILDPMCGGGTVLAEAAMAGRRAAIGYDVNPAALIIARAASAPLEPKDLRCEAKELLGKYDELCLGQEGLFRSRQSSSFKLIDLGDSSKFFTPEAHGHLSVLFRCISEIPNAAHQDFFLTCFFSVLRRASLCNVKKMNIEVDRNKKKVWPVNEIFPKAVNKNLLMNDDFYRKPPSERKCFGGCVIYSGDGFARSDAFSRFRKRFQQELAPSPRCRQVRLCAIGDLSKVAREVREKIWNRLLP